MCKQVNLRPLDVCLWSGRPFTWGEVLVQWPQLNPRERVYNSGQLRVENSGQFLLCETLTPVIASSRGNCWLHGCKDKWATGAAGGWKYWSPESLSLSAASRSDLLRLTHTLLMCVFVFFTVYLWCSNLQFKVLLFNWWHCGTVVSALKLLTHFRVLTLPSPRDSRQRSCLKGKKRVLKMDGY